MRKQRLRGNSLVTSPDLNLTLRRMTPRFAVGVWAERRKEKGKRQKAKTRIARAHTFPLRLCNETDLVDVESLVFTFYSYLLLLTSLEIRAAWKLQVRQAHATHEHLIGTYGHWWCVATAAGSCN